MDKIYEATLSAFGQQACDLEIHEMSPMIAPALCLRSFHGGLTVLSSEFGTAKVAGIFRAGP